MNIEGTLKEHFGLEALRQNQKPIIEAILSGKDTLGIMPTGGGKSLCFQLPAMLLDGVTLVVSPLISLMQDQVSALEQKGIAATMINSSISLKEQHDRIDAMRMGKYKLVYIAPERFRSERFLNALAHIKVALVAIDEAHCISQWGHDFRPDYLFIGKALERMGRPQVAGFTATATAQVRADIVKSLALQEPAVFVSGFARPNLGLSIKTIKKEAQKYARLSSIIESESTGIIYCSTRKRVEAVYEQLRSMNVSCVAYHGGMSDEQRKQAQDTFIAKKADVAVATNAFGMGIDRSDIRFVVHFEIPGSIEAYYQEIGRAGRDGEGSICELFFNYADKRIQEFFIEGSNPKHGLIVEVYNLLNRESNNAHEVYVSIDDLATGLQGKQNSMAVGTCLSWLVKSGCIERFDIPGERIRGTRILKPDLRPLDIPIDAEALLAKEQDDRAKLASVIGFAYSEGCRQQWILDFFGESGAGICGRCDNCMSFGREEASKRAPNSEEKLLIQKVLSGVARASIRVSQNEWNGLYGAYKIQLMLLGSKRSEVVDTKLKDLSTYGLLKGLAQDYLQKIFKLLEKEGLIEMSKNAFRLVTLTSKGYDVMQGSEDYALCWPEAKEARASKAKSARKEELQLETPEDEELYSLLRAKRSAIAKGKPPYTVLTNKALTYLAVHKPKTKEELLEIPGIGTYKMRTVMPAFVEVLQNYGDR